MRRGFRGLIVLSAVLALSATNALATPLGLSPGDEIDSMAFDALAENGDGAVYTAGDEIMRGDGRITAVILTPSGSISQSGVDFKFNLKFLNENNTLTGPGNNFLNTVAELGSPGALVTGPDVVITEGGTNVLFGDFGGLVTSTGSINLLQAGGGQFTVTGIINILGGDSSLTDALGGVGTGKALLSLTASLSELVPPANVIGQDGLIFNSNFSVGVSGTLTPLTSSPFVPEPSTALLLGAGMVGMLGVSRRARRSKE